MPFIGPVLAVVATVVGTVSAVAMTAITLISSLFKPKPPTTSTALQGRDISIKMAAAPRRIIYGRQRVGGVLTFVHTTGAVNEYLHLIYALSNHQIQSIDTLYFGDEAVPLDGSGFATGKYAGLVYCQKKLGTQSDAAFSNLLTAAPGVWTSDCKGLGVAAVYLQMKWDQDKLANFSFDQVSVDVHGKLLYDPRTATTAYSENAALCIRDYLTTPRAEGGVGVGSVDDALFIADANLCDEAVSLKAGGTEPRYAINGSFLLDENSTPANILSAMLTACMGQITYREGKWGLYSAAWRIPAGDTLTDTDCRDALQVSARRQYRDLFNSVKGTIVCPTSNWQPTDFPSLSDAAWIAEDSGFAGVTDTGQWAGPSSVYAANDVVWNNSAVYCCILGHIAASGNEPGVGASWTTYWAACRNITWKDLQLPFTISPATAQRLAKIYKERNRRQMSLTFPATMKGYQYAVPDVVEVTHPRWGFSSKTFEVAGLALGVDEKQMIPGVDLQLQETDSLVYAWNAATEEGALDAPHTTTLPDASAVQPCTSLGAYSGAGYEATGADGIVRNRILVTWANPADQFVLSGGRIHIYFRKTASPVNAWVENTIIAGSNVQCYIENVTDGVAYDIALVAENAVGAKSAQAVLSNYTVIALTSNVSQSTLLNNQGSINPTVTVAGPYTLTTGGPSTGAMFARATWTAHDKYRPDGSSYTIPASTSLATPPIPTLTSPAGGSLGSRNRYVRIAYVKNFTVFAYGPENPITVPANCLLHVASPPAVAGYDYWTPLVGDATNSEVLQPDAYGSPGLYVPFGTDWQEVATGCLVGTGTMVSDDGTAQAFRFWNQAVSCHRYAIPSWDIAGGLLGVPTQFQTTKDPAWAIKAFADGHDADAGGWLDFAIPAAGGSGGGGGGGGCPRKGFFRRPIVHNADVHAFPNLRWSRMVLENGAVSEATPRHAVYRADAAGALAGYLGGIGHLDRLDHEFLQPFKVNQRDMKVGDSTISHDAALRPILVAVSEVSEFEAEDEAMNVAMYRGHLYLVGQPGTPGVVSSNSKMIL